MASDETILAEEVGRLRTENEQLKSDLQARNRQFVFLQRSNQMAAFAPWGILFVLLSVFVGYPTWKWITSDTKITHYYMDKCHTAGCGDGNLYTVFGSIEWAEDNRIGSFKTFEEAMAAIKTLEGEKP